MQFSVSAILAIAAFSPAISAHLIMKSPQQWAVPDVTRSTVETSEGAQFPLLADGANYPCQGVAPEGSVATYEPGSDQTLELVGTAVHSGGSGQMSITYDTAPTKDSIFRVMTSWQGNHPVNQDGNILPADANHALPGIPFKVPSGLPAGKAVVAWTWFNKSGNREMYMKCATVTIGGSETSKAAFEALPTMFRANSGNGCTVPEGIQAIKFNNPGPDVIGQGVTPVACDSTKPGSGSTTGGSDGGDNSSSSPVTSPTPTSAPSATVSSAPSATNTSIPNATVIPVPSATVTPDEPTYDAPATSEPSESSAPASGTTCVEGTVTCNSDNTWSLCGSGLDQNMGLVAAGMTCKDGLFSKRSIRFSHEHMRRRHN